MRTPSCSCSAAFLLAATSSGENTPDFSRASMTCCTMPAVNSGWPANTACKGRTGSAPPARKRKRHQNRRQKLF